MPRAAIKGLPYDISIGIGSLSAVLKRAGHSVSLLNLNHYKWDSDEELIRHIRSHQPDVIGTGSMSFSYTLLQKYLRLAKVACPDAKTMVGGMVVTSQPEVVYDGLGVDIAIIGEAEETVVELMEVLAGNGDLAGVRGIMFRDEQTGALVTTPPRPLIQDIDSLPWPDYEGMGMDEFVGLRGQTDDGGLLFSHHDDPRMVPIMTSRGCPFKCTFCCYELVETKYRTRNLDDVMAEIEYLVDRFKINTLFIMDDLFSLKKSRLIEFCERIRPMNLNWQCSIRVRPVDRDMLILMRDSGCKAVSYGIESASPDVLLNMKKKITLDDINETLKITHDVGMGIGGNLIFCDPAETEKTVKESLQWFADNPRYIIRMAMVGFHPGTVIYRDAVAKGQIGDKVEYLEKNEYEINVTDISDAAYAELFQFIHFLGRTIGIAGKITSFTERGNSLMTLETECPHCQAPNIYKKVFKRQDLITWISCRSCNRRYKLPMFIVDEITPAIADTCEHPVAGDAAEKLQAYQEIAKDPFVHHNALLELGKLHLEAGNVAKAVVILKMSLTMNPYNPDYQRQYGAALHRAGDEDMARAHETQAQLLEDAGVENTLFIPVDQDIQLDVLVKNGLHAHQDGKLGEAEAVYRKVLGIDPDHADANHFLGVIAHQVGNHTAAVELIGTAIRHNSAAADYHCNLGNALYELGRLDEAADSQRQAIALNSNYAKAHNNLGNVRLAQGHFDDAVASYRKALLISPDDEEATANLDIALRQQVQMNEAGL
jgi:radical SAM superfamily enzyme YgiQ (UPF0313 family)/Flp pilus assembly protein TadD